MMEEHFKEIAGYVALGIEAAAALLIAFGAIEALSRLLTTALERRSTISVQRQAWVGFGVWLLLGLEFELGADILRTAIAPTWTDIGKLGAIAVIRTFLNYFLQRDLETIGEKGRREPTPEREERTAGMAE